MDRNERLRFLSGIAHCAADADILLQDINAEVLEEAKKLANTLVWGLKIRTADYEPVWKLLGINLRLSDRQLRAAVLRKLLGTSITLYEVLAAFRDDVIGSKSAIFAYSLLEKLGLESSSDPMEMMLGRNIAGRKEFQEIIESDTCIIGKVGILEIEVHNDFTEATRKVIHWYTGKIDRELLYPHLHCRTLVWRRRKEEIGY